MFQRTHASTFATALTLALALGACTTGKSTGTNGDNGGPNGGGDGTSAPANRFFLPTGEPDNTAAPSLEVDAKGGIHAIYPAYAGGGAYYAYCPADCSGADAVSVVRFETDGTVSNAMLTLDAEGKPTVLLNAYYSVYYASCDGDCSKQASWTSTPIYKHDNDQEVTGESFALDANGHPRFLMHRYVAYLGIGQGTPETNWMACDADCHSASSWTKSKIADDIWQRGTLRFDPSGRAHLAMAHDTKDESGSTTTTAAYALCDANCDQAASWQTFDLIGLYTSEYEAVAIKPMVTLALTKAGGPRIAALAKDDAGKKKLLYAECNDGCLADAGWTATVLSDLDEIDVGIDIAVDKNDHPRLVYTLNYNIGLLHCDDAVCSNQDSNWGLTKVELGSDMPADEIFLNTNCTVGAWFLHSPSIALTPDGLPRVGYQARDISGGFDHPDNPNTDCVAGTDMTWSRMAVLSGL